MTLYRSKIGLELVIPLSILFGGTALTLIIDQKWVGLAIVLVVLAVIIHLFITTTYKIENGNLNIRCGFIINETIAIKTIKKVSESNSILSAPAASIDRIEISYNQFDSVLISPKDKMKFITHLKEINPEIEVKLKKDTKHDF